MKRRQFIGAAIAACLAPLATLRKSAAEIPLTKVVRQENIPNDLSPWEPPVYTKPPFDYNDLYVSKEAMEDIRKWSRDEIDNTTKKEIRNSFAYEYEADFNAVDSNSFFSIEDIQKATKAFEALQEETRQAALKMEDFLKVAPNIEPLFLGEPMYEPTLESMYKGLGIPPHALGPAILDNRRLLLADFA